MGTVYLVGAGPGDPGLFTLRGHELLASADVVVYDALVGPGILERRSSGAELVFVGKRGGEPGHTQEEINRLLVDLAHRHTRVVRLKGGDPFVFGRGGEEADTLAAAGVPFEVVPGVTAGIAGAAYAGIPVTHRGVTSSVALVTGHEDPAKPASDLDWSALAGGCGTVVFYMGAGRLRNNFRSLIEHGRDPDTPAAVIEWATYPRQRTVMGTLATLPDLVDQAGVSSPAVVVVGEVVKLRERLGWFEHRPLSGRRIVVTRARAQASDFAAALEALGAEVLQFPSIRIHPPSDEEALLDAARQADRFDWLVFTSVNGASHFWNALHKVGRDTRALAGVSICAIGPATAAALQAAGVRPDLVPDRFVAEAVVEALSREADLEGVRVLLPRASGARPFLPDQLRARGADVVEVAAYETIADGAGASALREQLTAGAVDLITFTASSTVRSFVGTFGLEIGPAKVASIGPITSTTARALGLPVHLEAEEYTVPGLLQAIRGHYTRVGD